MRAYSAARPYAPARAYTATRGDYNCSDFASYAEALRVFRSRPGDPYGLDRDNDGIPCESLR